ncbi:putative nuclease HARBI1 [Sinocyclocheilus grahami]|uniref:putative nuclease HARBI1 n=1 Tax=Sinocyclocheilus grahami TaxID=75366 RepID=UPI0007AD03B5|nr:PREDICTED: putative nuclease HARBI1 [Sinocyclocheilus grahami]
MRRRTSAVWSYPREHKWWDTIVPEFTPEQFIQNFRVSRESFEYICCRLKHVLERRNTNFRLCVPVKKRIAIALWKLATGNEYRSVSQLFGVGVSTVFNCVQDFCNAVIKVLLPVHIKFPDSRKLKEMADVFENRWDVPQCVGAIDGSHIPIIAPEKYPRDYFNRKGWHSIVIQAVVDGKGLFWDLCVGHPGSVHDARVLRQSYLWKMLNDGHPLNQSKVHISGYDVGYYLIGDSAYPLQNWLMKPFPDTGRLTPQQQRFNLRLSCARSVVDSSFGRLKARWRCLLKRSDCKLELIKKMVLTCCVLHNICEERDHFSDDLSAIHMYMQPPVQALIDHGQPEGTDVQAALLGYFNGQDSEIIQVAV